MLQVISKPILGDSEYRDCKEHTYGKSRGCGKGSCRRMISRDDVQYIGNRYEKKKSPDEGQVSFGLLMTDLANLTLDERDNDFQKVLPAGKSGP